MKRNIIKIIGMVAILISTTSCATILGGEVTQCQKIKPQAGQPKRPIRVGVLIADILLFWPGVFIDAKTGALYKPCDNNAMPIIR